MADADTLKAENKKKWAAWRPKFADYDVVVSNYNGEPWPEEVQKAFEEYVSGGGGFVSVHAADNAFPQWKAYNEMIAVGGWGGRNEKSGPYLRLRDGKWTKDTTPGRGGAHGSQHEFLIEIQQPDHPIVKGLPKKWMHAQDELYDRLRGPAVNVTVLASAFASPDHRGSGEHEPMLMVTEYGDGRCFHTTLGHSTVSMKGRGFQETLVRGAEWVATGKVTFPDVPASELPAEGKAAVAED
ncbi:MAG: ThuA domain-containing protein [Verrucomicrobiales bacterium]|nr:ThuA domain-containing protein [Verrucomicrobiales bacterium]